MNWKIAFVALIAMAFSMSACHKEKAAKPAPKPAAKAECKLKGSWNLDQTGDGVADNKQRTLSLSFNDNKEGDIATGTLKVGTRPDDASTFTASASDIDTIQSGGAANMNWTYGDAEVQCQVKFVEECERLEFSCPDGDTFRIGRK